jgi:osmotically-inducible protein OsmY
MMMAALSCPADCNRTQLARQVAEQLQATRRPTLQAIQVHEHQGTSGRAPNFYLKQLAQSIATSVSGVHRLQNQITVSPTI